MDGAAGLLAANASSLARQWGEAHRKAEMSLGIASSESYSANSAVGHEQTVILPINTINAVGDSAILVIQDSDAWGIDMFTFILDEFGIVSTVINSSQIAATDFAPFDVIITTGDQSTSYYDAISANVGKFEDFVSHGGAVQYQLATQGSNVAIAGGVDET